MRKIWQCAALFALVTLIACNRSPELEVLDEYESAELAARAWSFQVYPGATFRKEHTEAFRRAHALLNPATPEPPPMAVYSTSASIAEVAKFYAGKYGYESVAPAGTETPGAPTFFTTGDLGTDTRNIESLLRQLGYDHDYGAVSGAWEGAHVSATGPYPRVTIQRPFYDFITGQIRDETLILMVREEARSDP